MTPHEIWLQGRREQRRRENQTIVRVCAVAMALIAALAALVSFIWPALAGAQLPDHALSSYGRAAVLVQLTVRSDLCEPERTILPDGWDLGGRRPTLPTRDLFNQVDAAPVVAQCRALVSDCDEARRECATISEGIVRRELQHWLICYEPTLAIEDVILRRPAIAEQYLDMRSAGRAMICDVRLRSGGLAAQGIAGDCDPAPDVVSCGDWIDALTGLSPDDPAGFVVGPGVERFDGGMRLWVGLDAPR